ncbi:NAD dependent epimerase/dehydratase family [Verrucomicrobiia bacterium DG1235]|nr:NAD dependent epimerase/dehydratase family [Verrucomicrobiae bacterium DG1235]
MKILIIGGTKFIGAHLARHLLEAGHTLTLLNRGQQAPPFPLDLETIHCDRAELPAKRPELAGRSFDVAIDMICMNTSNIRQTIDALEGIVPRICVISSMDVYRARDILAGSDPSPVDNSPLTETSPLRSRLFPYQQGFKPGDDLYQIYDKIPVEATLQTLTKSDWTICRLPCVYGPGDYQRRLLPFSKRFTDKRSTILMDRDWAAWRWTWGYVEEVARAIAAAALHPAGANQIFNIGEEQTPSFQERFALCSDILDWPLKTTLAKAEKLPSNEDWAGLNLAQHWIADTSKIRSLLGYQEILTPKECLQKTLDWELANPPESVEPTRFDYAAEDAYISSQSSN